MTTRVDVLVSGAGPVGMATALLAARTGHTVALVDARADGAWQNDPRTLALSEGSRHLLQRLGAWPSRSATPITDVHVSQQGRFGRCLLTAAEQHLPALGYVLGYPDVCSALRHALAQARIPLYWNTPPPAADDTGDGLAIPLASGALTTRLLVHAEGFSDDPATTRIVDYGHDALLCEVTPSHPHGGRAWERFTPDGPLALLPRGTRYAVVLVARRDDADYLLAADDTTFCTVLEGRLSGRLHFSAPGSRTRIPLALRMRSRLSAPRRLWIGNAAQALHPVSGQGLNLGLRDAARLGEALAGLTARGNGDPGLLADRPVTARDVDRAATIAFTDGLVRLFGGDLPALPAARGLGLAALDICPPARHAFADRMIFGLRP